MQKYWSSLLILVAIGFLIISSYFFFKNEEFANAFNDQSTGLATSGNLK